MKIGFIMLWYGLLSAVPAGWQICDGTNGTPDLRNRFVPGAGTAYNPGDNGGADSHVHAFTTDGHSHTRAVGSPLLSGANLKWRTSTEQDTGNVDAGDNRPKYHALAYIMKM